MTVAVGIREFRQDLASYVDAGEPVEVTRHGQTVGLFLPTRKGRRSFDPARLLAAGARLDADLAEKGIDPDDLIREADEILWAHRRGRPFVPGSPASQPGAPVADADR